MRRKLAARFERVGEDSGAILPLITLMLVVLMGMAAFATDLGWMFVNSSRIQRAAEASALSAVVELPVNPAAASAVAYDVANRNGYPAGSVTPQPMPGGVDTRMRVTITETIDLFFLSIFGFDTQTITREATAEYFPPLPLGSRGGQFGNSCKDPGCSLGGPNFNFWANIHGRDTDVNLGDAYSSRCASGTGSGSPSCAQNPDYRQAGYLYGIEANGGGSFTIEFNDIEFRWDSLDEDTADDIRTGDRGCEIDAWGPGTGNPIGVECGPGIRVSLYSPDATPLDISDNPLLCTRFVDREPQLPETDPFVFDDQGLCGVASPTAGIYVLAVEVVPPGGPLGNAGLNRYSIRTPGARVYGLRDISIFASDPLPGSQFDLAEVSDIYRGKTLVIEMFDLGDESPVGSVEIRDPAGNLQATFPAGLGNNGAWARREIIMSDTYSCGTSCWWTATYSGPVTDTTTWRAYVEGAPIWVIPNT